MEENIRNALFISCFFPEYQGSLKTLRIDSHNHFWKYDPAQHTWMTDQMGVLKRDYLPDDFKPLLEQAGFDGSVVVQARQSLEETEWLLGLAERYDFLKGVVGWVDLQSPEVRSQLGKYSSSPHLLGVRHVVHDEPDDRFMLRKEFLRGIEQLEDFELSYDLLLFPKHLPVAAELVRKFPQQRFVVDHIAKPSPNRGPISGWKEDIERLASFPKVYCKLSGMVTEASWNAWHAEDFHAYLDHVHEAFGPERLMIGSDWPVCTLAGSYAAVMQIVIDWLERFQVSVRENILGGNCATFYKLRFEN